MSHQYPSPKARQLAQWLLAYEGGPEGVPTVAPAAWRVAEKLRRHLGKLLGPMGFRTLLSRALTLAARENQTLSDVRVNADGSLEGLAELPSPSALEAHAVLITYLLALLMTFIGETLTLQLVRDVWADLAVVDATSSDEAK